MNNPASNQWISVNDRLPNINERVLGTCGANVVLSYRNESGFWCEFDGRISWQPSYWMPLPEPPPKPDPFEEWWKTNHSLPCIADIRWVVRPDSPSALGSSSKDVAKVIWDAAIESFNRESQDNIQAQLHETLCQPRNPQNT